MTYHLTKYIRKVVNGFSRLAWATQALFKLQLYSRIRLGRHIISDVRLIASSDLFDREWYLRENPDVRIAGVDPALHYVLHGAVERRDPSPLFDSEWYLNQNPDAQRVGANPLVHYLRLGAIGGSLPKPVFNSGWPVARPVHWRAAREPALNIVFINYGSFNNNSAAHIVGFANALADRGHNVIMCASGAPDKVAEYGVPQFRCVNRAMLTARPEALRDIIGDEFDHAPTLIHCWTPRETVRLAATALVGRIGCPYFIHLEDNDELVTRSLLGVTAAQASQMSSRGWDERVHSVLSHPFHARTFISGAAGVTIIVDALRALVPGNPVHLLEPGLDTRLLTARLDPNDRNKLCRELAVPSDGTIIVYPGNVHTVNAGEMLALYEAIHLLNSRGTKAHLIRTGVDSRPGPKHDLERLSAKHVTDLGFVDRHRLVEILKLADLFVQPGRPSEFNYYRLPSKLPEFLALGRPLILPAANLGLRLRDGIDALLLHRGDATEIADRVTDVLRDNDLAERLGRNARYFAVENFDWQRSASGLDDFYRAALVARTRGHILSDFGCQAL